jgi:hypothetical protein
MLRADLVRQAVEGSPAPAFMSAEKAAFSPTETVRSQASEPFDGDACRQELAQTRRRSDTRLRRPQ